MSTKHIRTTGDLVRFEAKLHIECGACGSVNILTGMEAVHFGGIMNLNALQRRLRCSQCAARAAKIRPLV